MALYASSVDAWIVAAPSDPIVTRSSIGRQHTSQSETKRWLLPPSGSTATPVGSPQYGQLTIWPLSIRNTCNIPNRMITRGRPESFAIDVC